MLTQLEIWDFAIVEAARLDLGPGLCVLTGETGAGKSIVIDAIGALVGGRAGADLIRSGADAARLRAVFDLSDSPAVTERLRELGLEPDPDGLCLLTREIRRDGRSRCTLNGSVATVTLLRQLGEALIDIHGQHEHQSLMRVSEHGRLLDSMAGERVAAAKSAWAALFGEWRATLEAAGRLRLDERAKEQRAEQLRQQVSEIDAAQLQPGEEEELRAERNVLSHAEQLLAWANGALEALQDADEAPATDRVGEALEAVDSMAAVDPELAPLADELRSAQALLEEAARALSRYAAHVEVDPLRLDAVHARLELLGRLQRRYGPSVAAVLAAGQAAAAELDDLASAADRLVALEQRRARLDPALATAAADLTDARREAAAALTIAVEGHLADLNLSGVRFVVAVQPRGGDEADAAWGPDGADHVEFLFSANPGEPPRPLARIASGGEISRVMLALKSELAVRDAIPTMIFDEIDVGIGGVTIRSVAAKMAAIARTRQVLVVTHHAPIAAHADVHVALEKASGPEATRLTVQRIEGEGRVQELARMLGRKPPTEATLGMARELLAECARD